jgi:assimilatory nitrate reductase catalytic subunit
LWELAGDCDPAMLDRLLPQGQRIEALDPARGVRRLATLQDGRLVGALFVAREGLPPRDWLVAQLEAAQAAPTLLAGRAPGGQADRGPIICACFDVGLKTILAAVADQQLADVAAIGTALKAGTNCGSCRPALAKLLAETSQPREVAHG